jgi:hypothetical protein
MEYFILFMVFLYLVYFTYCVNFFRKESGLKSHEKAYWVFICLAFPFISHGLYRGLRKRATGRLGSPRGEPNGS